MLKNYLKIAWRNIVKRKFNSIINIFGLALGIACSLFLYLFISYHLSFDSYHEKSKTTYRIVYEILFEQTLPDRGASMAMYEALKPNVPQIQGAAVILRNYTFTISVTDKLNVKKRFKEDHQIALVSPEWFKLFNYNWIEGSADQLKTPNTAVLTLSQASKYFGNADPIGKIIVFENRQPVKIVGLIADKPSNTDLKAGMYVSLSSLKNIKPDVPEKFFTDWQWLNSSTEVYLNLSDNKQKEEVESAIARMAKSHLGDNAKYFRFKLQPLADVHFNSSFGGTIKKSMLFTLIIIGILILLIASINYINFSIAQQAKRSVEIGTRKVLGGLTQQIFTQFITETVLTTFLAMLFAIGMVALILPVANQTFFADEPLALISYKLVSIYLCVLFIVLVALCGIYPALKLSRLNVFAALKNETSSWKAGLLRKVLVVAQNSAAQTLIVCTIIMLLQVRYLKQTDMGFNRDAVVMLPIADSSELKKDLLAKKMQSMPQIQSFSFCFRAPSSENDRGGSVHFNNRSDWESWPARSAIGDTSYLKSFGLQLVAGRNIREGSDINHEFLINQKMVSKLGLKLPEEVLGKVLIAGELDNTKGVIVGVVKDFNTKSLLEPIEPVLITNFKKMQSTVGIKLSGRDLQETIKRLQRSFEEVYPDEVFDYHFLDDQIAKLYRKEDLQQKLIWVAASIAVIISCLGLLSLVSLITLQRNKEIGIRKILGASASSLVGVLSIDFIKLIGISILIASPVAWYVMHVWLQGFAYKINISWWIFVSAGLLTIFVSLITISFQTIKAAIANPVKSLRSE
ncbi:MAG: hypothetical protein JWN56_1127 [Sphingobacteriales bacterium]|nr:hypothetical protein [Sphingobacteriales bacterium]